MTTATIDKKEIEANGIYKRTVYGVCEEFAWKVYDYKGERYQVSQFSDEVEHVHRIYCEVCGRKFLPSLIKSVLGVHTCLSCAKQMGE